MSIHGTMAQTIPDKSYLECQTCGSRLELNDDNKAGFLAIGWPKCCGFTMRLITPKVTKGKGE